MYIRWVARILGLAFCAYLVQRVVILGLAWGWLYILHGWLCLWLVPLITLGVAWKWSGQRPELVGGVTFIVWSAANLTAAYLAGYFEPFSFFVRDMLVQACIPVITGVLFILAYRRGLAKS